MVYRGYTSNILRNLCMHFPHFEPPSVDRAEYRPTYVYFSELLLGLLPTLYSIYINSLHICARRSRYQQITIATLEEMPDYKYLRVGASYMGSNS